MRLALLHSMRSCAASMRAVHPFEILEVELFAFDRERAQTLAAAYAARDRVERGRRLSPIVRRAA